MKRAILKIADVTIFISVLLTFMACASEGDSKQADSLRADSIKKAQEASIYEYGIKTNSLKRVDGVIKEGESVSTLLNSLGIGAADVNRLEHLPDSIFNATRIIAGNNYFVYYEEGNKTPKYFVYQKSLVEFSVIEFGDSIKGSMFRKPVQIIEKVDSATITSSLWQAIDDSNINLNVANELSDIYAWTIDFFGIQEGDHFTVYYTDKIVDSTSIGIGEIYAARFNHKGKDYYAIKFDTLGCKGYWEIDGSSLKKAFLRAPLNFKRISSTFTYHRLHPVYRVVRPHTGVDYAAPTGTPVWTIGDGKVIFKGRAGGGGNTVKIEHNKTYTTSYMHLSKYADGLKVGDRVTQGQVIGYVGSTGTATGPHLDFRVWKNGTPIDPLKMESTKSDPIPSGCMAAFNAVKDKYLEKLK